uniref:Uncharacterized protein n=1 Tax=Romanomermis culicivorax TaxID=13658 RepID=A0A915KLU5_ROMCU
MKNLSGAVAERLSNDPTIQNLRAGVVQFSNGLSYSQMRMDDYDSSFSKKLQYMEKL